MRERTLTVSQLNAYIKGVFEDELVLHNIRVEGEVYEYKQTPSATFVTLREQEHLLSCVASVSTEKLSVGDKVSLFGSVTFYARSGKISFVYSSVRRMGEGTILAEFNALRDKMQAEGLFDRKKPFPPLIRKLAIVTAETGAVIHDFIKTVHRKRVFTDIDLYPSSVQGSFALSELVSQLKLTEKGAYDAVVIARGGGSSDDLDVFNKESLVRAVADCPFPVISAVGHETDFTLCDFTASLRAGTPSMAGEFISRHNEEFFSRWEYAVAALDTRMQNQFARKASELYRSAAALSYKSEVKLERVEQKTERLAERLDASMMRRQERLQATVLRLGNILNERAERAHERVRARLEKMSADLNANNPLRILSAGYAKLYRENGQSACYENTAVGDTIHAAVRDGILDATVTHKRNLPHGGGQYGTGK